MIEVASQMTLPIVSLFRALRPKQWVKNAVLLAGILFTLNHGHPLSDWLRVAAGVLVFCLLSSSIYLVNDIADVEQDRHHPKKRFRPIAAGLVAIPTAIVTAVVVAITGLAGAVALGRDFAIVAGAYLVLTISYTAWLKHMVLLDVMALSGCYVLRAAAGAAVISVEISPWLLVCTTLGALLIGLAKRRNELVTLEDAGSHRKILEEYTVGLLDQLITIVTAATLMAYMLYTFFSPTAKERPLLMVTIPFVIYGIFRFLYLMHRHGKGGDPSSELIEDRNLLACAALWGLTVGAVMLLGH
ncbi:MAG: UbiA prenyltransferase [Armatimonadetes bacterium]|jgi:4-hydroxybenzoate polyprenyltransferase|nr:UbiA prenyltransferase [Armatimonadota bacterium]